MNKNFSFRKVIVCLAIVIVCATILPFNAMASEIDATLQTVASSAYLSDLCSQANSEVGVTILSYEAGDGLLRFSNKEYQKLETADKQAFMECALSYVSKIPDTASAKMKNAVYNFISQQDTAVTAAMKYLQVNAGADLVEAEKWFKPASGVIGTVMGLFCVLIFMFLGFSVLFDIFYIVIPPFQAMLNAGSDGNKKPWGISREAWCSIQEAEKTDAYKNVLSMYFSRRVVVLIIVSIAITYLVSGKIFELVGWFVDSFSG